MNNIRRCPLWECFDDSITIEPGLFLRKASIEDHVNLFKYNKGNVRESFFPFSVEEEMQAWLNESLIKCQKGEKLELILYSTKKNFIGSIGINNLQTIPEFGIWIREDLQRHGYGKKAMLFLSRWLLETGHPYLLYKSKRNNKASLGLAKSLVLEEAEPSKEDVQDGYKVFKITRSCLFI